MASLTSPAPAPATPDRPRRSPAAWIAATLIRGYQYLFAWTPSHCRFAPSCSQYALEAVTEHGRDPGLVARDPTHRPLPPLERRRVRPSPCSEHMFA